MRNNYTKNAGFTLLEIMVVIVILGILAGLVVQNLLPAVGQADRQAVVTNIKTLEGAMDMYKLDNKHYPTTDQGLEALVSKPDSAPEARNYREGGYIPRLPKDPWGNEYILTSPGENGRFDIYSAGEDMEEGSDDDIGNWNMFDDKE